MKNSKILAQAAEAIIYKKDGFVIKDRIPKSYRIKIIDDKIRKSRTKSEIKLLTKASSIINAPSPIEDDSLGAGGGGNETTQIKMPFIDGKKLSEHLNNFPEKEQEQICLEIGKSIAKLHDANILHGDLTTSNMILVEEKKGNKKISSSLTASQGRAVGGSDGGTKVYFIDFGLGFISHKLEDKAVDLHLLKQALEAKHFQNWEKLFDAVIKGYLGRGSCTSKGYSKSTESKKVLERLKAVEKRGRYKH